MKLSKEVKIGIFALLTLLALYWGVNFLKGSDMFSRNNHYYATYDQVNGIQKSSAIVVKGFKVGVISDISYDPQKSEKIVLEFTIKSKFKIPENSKARIYSDGLLGSKAVEIELGDSDRFLADRDTLRSEIGVGLFEMAGSELEFVKQKAGRLVDDLTLTLNNINTLLTGNQAALTSTMNNLSQMTSSLNQVMQAQSGALGSAISNISSLSSTLKDNAGRIDNILGNVEQFTDSLRGADLTGTVNNLSQTLDEFNGLLAAANSGEGTLGKLFADEALYDSLVVASGSLSRLLEDIKAHPGRYIHLSVFGRRN